MQNWNLIAQASTLPTARNKGNGWTSRDLAVVADRSRPATELAKETGRTLFGVYAARNRPAGSTRVARRRAGEWTPEQIARAMAEL